MSPTFHSKLFPFQDPLQPRFALQLSSGQDPILSAQYEGLQRSPSPLGRGPLIRHCHREGAIRRGQHRRM